MTSLICCCDAADFNQAGYAIINADQRDLFEGVSLNHCVEFSSSQRLANGYGVDGEQLMHGRELLMLVLTWLVEVVHRENALVVFAIADILGLPRSWWWDITALCWDRSPMSGSCAYQWCALGE